MRRYSSLRGRREFASVLRRGRPSSTQTIAVFALPARADRASQAKVGFVITKKVGKAVERNRLRRRCKAIIDEIQLQNGIWLVVQCRPGASALAYAELRKQLTATVRESVRRAGNPRLRRESPKR
jgi:ribonuclease P protein component